MSESEEKTNPASAQKLRKQRDKGSIPSGQEVAKLISTAAGLLALATMAPAIWKQLIASLEAAPLLMQLPFEEASTIASVKLGQTIFFAVGPLVGVIFLSGFLTTLIFNRGFVFSLDPVAPKLNRISVTSGFKRIFGRRGWMELAVSAVRVALWLMVAAFIGKTWLPSFMASPTCAGACTADIAVPLVWIILIAAIAIILGSAAIEVMIQKNQFLHEQRMTKTEVKRERKNSFGSPEVRRERNRLRNEALQETTKPGAKNGNFLFFGPDCAVVIRYQPPDEKIPFVVAKVRGADEVANLRRSFTGNGRLELSAPALATAAQGTELGSGLDSQHYTLLTTAFDELFG